MRISDCGLRIEPVFVRLRELRRGRRRTAAVDEARLEEDFGLRLGGTGITLTLPSHVKGEGEHGMGIGYQRGGDWSTQNAACVAAK